MAAADRDQLTVLLAVLAARFDALRPLYPEPGYAVARHALHLAVLLDQQLRAQLAGDLSVNVRDAAMASTMSWLLSEDDARIILIAANSHIQRVPVVAGPYRFPVLGQHLAASLGSAYVAVGMTALTGTTVTRRAAPDAPAGFETAVVDLPPAPPESAEAVLGAGLHRLTPRSPAGTSLRTLDTFTDLPVASAFDALACLTTTEPWRRRLHRPDGGTSRSAASTSLRRRSARVSRSPGVSAASNQASPRLSVPACRSKAA
jgi:erythromycin esterase